MIKLVALDLDDTLLNSKLKISPETAAAVRSAVELGVTVTFATGRMYSSALPYARELGLDVPLITYQGALMKTSNSQEVLYNKPVPMDLAREILSFAAEEGLDVNMYLEDSLYVRSGNSSINEYVKLARVPYKAVPDLAEVMVSEPHKLLIVASPGKIDRLAAELQERWEGKLHLTKSKPYFLEFTHPAATKGQAIDSLAAELGIGREEIMAVGDSYNDLDMIDYAGVGVAMGNAVQEIKDRADYVTRGNNEHGVAEAIRRFVLEAQR